METLSCIEALLVSESHTCIQHRGSTPIINIFLYSTAVTPDCEHLHREPHCSHVSLLSSRGGGIQYSIDPNTKLGGNVYWSGGG